MTDLARLFPERARPTHRLRDIVGVRRALLLDLDDTLVVEKAAAKAAFCRTARFAAAKFELDERALALGARWRARELWYSAPEHRYCMCVGISSWEGLWCRFEGEQPEVRALRAWAPTYRREAWRLALVEQGIENVQLADELGERFGVERRSRHELFDDARAAVEAAAGSHSLALVTNGASCLQREKLHARMSGSSWNFGSDPHGLMFTR